jgi:hypothetical protein
MFFIFWPLFGPFAWILIVYLVSSQITIIALMENSYRTTYRTTYRTSTGEAPEKFWSNTDQVTDQVTDHVNV